MGLMNKLPTNEKPREKAYLYGIEKLTNAAKNKINMLNNSKLKYLVSSAFAGLYVGLGII